MLYYRIRLNLVASSLEVDSKSVQMNHLKSVYKVYKVIQGLDSKLHNMKFISRFVMFGNPNFVIMKVRMVPFESFELRMSFHVATWPLAESCEASCQGIKRFKMKQLRVWEICKQSP